MSKKILGLFGTGLSALFFVYLLLNFTTDVVYFFLGSGALYLSIAQVMGVVALIIIIISIALAIKKGEWGVVALFFILIGIALIYAWHIANTWQLQFMGIPIMLTNQKRKLSVPKKIRWFAAFIIICLALALLVYLRPSTMLVFAGALALFLGLLMLNKGRKETVNLSTDITPIAFAFLILVLSIYYFIIGYTVAIAVAIVMLILIYLLYAVI